MFIVDKLSQIHYNNYSMFLSLLISLILMTQQVGQDQLVVPHHYELSGNWALSNSLVHNNLEIEKAWKEERGISSIIVAVIDTGVDLNHVDIKDSLWQDPTKKEESHGWNFFSNNSEVRDIDGHGTHIAGIIAGKYNEKFKTSGIAPNVKVMVIKSINPMVWLRHVESVKLITDSIKFAINNHANIINISASGSEFIKEERDLIALAGKMGILVVASAGNNNNNVDYIENKEYPAAYNLSNLISVGATNFQNQKSDCSNYGESVDVSAPGEGILSTAPNSFYVEMEGTSPAAAMVSGIAALLLSKDPNLTPEEVKAIILTSSDKIPVLSHKNKVGGRANAYRALQLLYSYKQSLNLLTERKIASHNSANRR